jgi:NAD(P)-dependent dehydrogenase (short-subunit alcohol dehydrogenase family)
MRRAGLRRTLPGMDALKDKVAIVTGASSGIGFAAAKLFAREGAKVVAAARRKAELEALCAEIADAGGEAVAVNGDVRSEGFVRELTEVAVERFGGLDIALNNAGTTGVLRSTPEISLAEWEDTVRTNLTSAFLHALKRIATPEEIARSALYLASDASSFTTGTALLADGGVSISRT